MTKPSENKHLFPLVHNVIKLTIIRQDVCCQQTSDIIIAFSTHLTNPEKLLLSECGCETIKDETFHSTVY